MKETALPATSKAQQRAAGTAQASETRVKDLQGASKEMYKCMTEGELENLATTEHDELPERKED
jgi:hypothetical protein